MPDPLQRFIALVATALTLPLLAVLGLAVRLDSPGPAIYAGRRVGSGGRLFLCHKLRTMRAAAGLAGSPLTVGGDRRITRVGRFLRRTRLDELPQLWDVARGEMRLVGPRPEAPEFVDLGDPLQCEVVEARPGITGLAQLFHVDETAELHGGDPAAHYREMILPGKLRLDAAYLRHRSTRLDLWILAQTPLALAGHQPAVPAIVRAAIADA